MKRWFKHFSKIYKQQISQEKIQTPAVPEERQKQGVIKYNYTSIRTLTKDRNKICCWRCRKLGSLIITYIKCIHLEGSKMVILQNVNTELPYDQHSISLILKPNEIWLPRNLSMKVYNSIIWNHLKVKEAKVSVNWVN